MLEREAALLAVHLSSVYLPAPPLPCFQVTLLNEEVLRRPVDDFDSVEARLRVPVDPKLFIKTKTGNIVSRRSVLHGSQRILLVCQQNQVLFFLFFFNSFFFFEGWKINIIKYMFNSWRFGNIADWAVLLLWDFLVDQASQQAVPADDRVPPGHSGFQHLHWAQRHRRGSEDRGQRDHLGRLHRFQPLHPPGRVHPAAGDRPSSGLRGSSLLGLLGESWQRVDWLQASGGLS